MQRVHVWLLVVIGLTFAVYAPSLGNGFTYDDAVVVRVPTLEMHPNEVVGELQPLGTYFSMSYSAGHAGYGRGFRPITVLSFAIVHHFTKASETRRRELRPDQPVAPASAQHLVNLLLHCLCVFLTFRVLLLFGAGLPALLGAAVFGLHAVRSDPVISMVGRGEILGYAFGTTTLLLVVAGLRRQGFDRSWRIGLAGVTMFLAVCSKESAAAWLVLVPLVVWLLRDREAGLRPIGPWLLALVIPFGVFLVLLFQVWAGLEEKFEPAYDSNPFWYQATWLRIVNGVIVLGYGLYKIFAPIHLVHDYSAEVFAVAEGVGDVRFLIAMSVLVAVLVLGLRMRRRQPLLFLAMAIFFGFAFLTSNIPFPIETVFGERLLYTPAAALSCVVAWVANTWHGGRRNHGVIAVVSVWSLVCGALIFGRCGDWVDNQTLFTVDSVKQPNCIRTQMARMKYLQMGPPQEWKNAIDRAHAARPDHPAPLHELAVFHNRFGQPKVAAQFATQGLESTHIDARDQKQDLELQLAIALAAQGETAHSFKLFEELATVKPGPELPDVRPFLAYSKALARIGKVDSARAVLRRLLRASPRALIVWDELLFLAHRQRDEAKIDALLAEMHGHVPGAPTLDLHKAMSQYRRGDRQRAPQVFLGAMQNMPPRAETSAYFAFLARMLVDQNRKQEARQLVGDFLRDPRMSSEDREPFEALARQLDPPK